MTDTKAPTITVTPLVITLELDSASPTLLDGVSTDDGSTVTATGTVDVSTVGDYTINYDSTDGTNAATTVTRTPSSKVGDAELVQQHQLSQLRLL